MMFFNQVDSPVSFKHVFATVVIIAIAALAGYLVSPAAQEMEEVQKIGDEMHIQHLAKLPAGAILSGEMMSKRSGFCMKTVTQKDGTFMCNIFNSPIMLDVRSAVMGSHVRLNVVALPSQVPSVWEKTVASNAFQVEIAQ